MHTPAEFVADAQLDARDYFVTLAAADGPAVRMPGAPFRSSPALFEITCAAPRLGEHNHDVYVDELGHTSDELRCWRDDGLV